MAKKLKEYYDLVYIEFLSDKIIEVYPEFNKEKFKGLSYPEINSLEFGDRQTLLANNLNLVMELPYSKVLSIFSKVLGPELEDNSGTFSQGYWLWPIGKYVELFGANYFKETTNFTKELTKCFTAEYCMRPILKKYPIETLNLLEEWSRDTNLRVRRLASECVRIRLPWAKKIDVGLTYFEEFYKILDNLKNDPDKYIQKSVANNLNDLYKESPDKFAIVIQRWKKNPSDECQWIMKHGSRNVQ
ncbi:DNA alkylation repair protein [Aerococcaceae bacterium INB8]|uniref:DNA alkylation repair protein n=1 Tax=Ruoffia halotolerans TaxID=2748684 RepID=A0A839A604_9LACT|nr:DNA alkylation repair protein [Ruoffia halotolerans]MBA5729274.1 DNA alkylation repair protein [Ruoffia halotolerans]